MTEWHEDEQVWDALDLAVEAVWLPLKDLLDLLHEHRDELEPQSSAFLFGGLGQFVRVYATRRGESNTPVQAYVDAMAAVQNDRRIQTVFQQAAEEAVDARVKEMKEGR